MALQGNNKAKDFDNLPSMRSDSQASSSKERGFNKVQKLQFKRDEEQISQSEVSKSLIQQQKGAQVFDMKKEESKK